MSHCPSCGVAVVPGYVRCPKCHKPLPAARRTPMNDGGGGTAVPARGGFPVVPVVLGLAVVGGLLAFFLTQGGDKPEAQPTKAPNVTAPMPTATTTPDPTAPTTIAAPTSPSGPDPAEIAALIDRDLKKQRLWGTVEVVGARLDVRSGGCEDPAMAPLIDGQMQALKGAGLTKLRCLEQSGRVVFERDL
ncbi:MAG: hypothetical protein SFX73_25035 [Kofleriaceae bacterium]|nr:hypothetical protein [Kofleriaceae bacterium]